MLEGAVNFRDMGGYATTEFRSISMGLIYRSGDISQLTDKDMEELKRRRLYTVIDFRGEEEAANAPDCLLPGADYLLLPSGSPGAAFFAQDHISDKEAMLAFYSDISYFKEKYRPFFKKILTLPDTSALLFHGNIGKDRTGIAAALLLCALDVPMETIFSDYVATDFFREPHNRKAIDDLVEKQGIERETATRLMEANPEYLQATFAAILQQYGSMAAFLRLEFGIGEGVKLSFQEKYLR
jgi:protein-tyrosine phosphatase